ncbi:MAG: quinoprotein dehydrogenase-associated putative ABC transporter substrate-binding protein [Gammaproteobacteria bacterium]|jgi:quinoprotein dehydrogenase-associated probable ABC transporter substrate-binding protein
MSFSRTGFSFPLKSLVGLFFAVLLTSVLSPAVRAKDSVDKDVLRVCADPYMLPYSNKKGQGYENKIAELLARKMNAKLEYKFFPQRMGFIRNTLRKQKSDGTYDCDLVISVPENFELAATTKPYYTSTYMLVYRKWKGMGDVSTPAEFAKAAQEKSDFKMGLTDRGPAQLWVFRHDLMGKMIPYQGQPGDPKHDPGQMMMDDLAAGKIDATIVWGPTAGYYAKKLKDKADISMLRMHNDPKHPDTHFVYSIAMAVRYGEKNWKNQVQKLINENQGEINDILKEYGVPLLPLKVSTTSDDD